MTTVCRPLLAFIDRYTVKLAIIGVPYDLDLYNQGKGLAPAALLAAGLRERLETAGAQVEQVYRVEATIPNATQEERLGLLLKSLAFTLAQARSKQQFPVVLGGDCLTALGTLAGLGNSAATTVAWIDAHGDFNTPATTVSGYLGGMPLACAVGRGLDTLREAVGLEPLVEQHIALLGVRDLDSAESALLEQSELTVISANNIERREGNLRSATILLGATAQLYLHLDIDVLNNTDAPGVDYPAPGGLTPTLLNELLMPIACLPNLAAVALTAFNPERDHAGRTLQAALAALETIIAHAVATELQR